ncbi:hypothetical protein H8958_018066 [Nasalis larvatus]
MGNEIHTMAPKHFELFRKSNHINLEHQTALYFEGLMICTVLGCWWKLKDTRGVFNGDRALFEAGSSRGFRPRPPPRSQSGCRANWRGWNLLLPAGRKERQRLRWVTCREGNSGGADARGRTTGPGYKCRAGDLGKRHLAGRTRGGTQAGRTAVGARDPPLPNALSLRARPPQSPPSAPAPPPAPPLLGIEHQNARLQGPRRAGIQESLPPPPGLSGCLRLLPARLPRAVQKLAPPAAGARQYCPWPSPGAYLGRRTGWTEARLSAFQKIKSLNTMGFLERSSSCITV